jgi:hypothetical protein
LIPIRRGLFSADQFVYKKKVDLAAALAMFDEPWSPRIVGTTTET